MKTLLPQGFSRSLLSLTTCGYLPYSRQNSLNLATHRSQGCVGNLGSPLFQGDGPKSRSADCRRSTRREHPRGGLAPLPWSCEVSIDLVSATETLGQDRIHIISITARRTALDWCRRENGRVVFLRGKSRSKCDCPRDRSNYPAFMATNNTRIEPRQRQRRAESAAYTAGAACAVTHSRELQSAIRLRRQAASTCLTLVTPARLPTIGESRD
jgi:hypothetical protein